MFADPCGHDSQLTPTGVVVEKLVFCTNGQKSDDRKCLPGPRKSLVGNPGAINFPRILKGWVFQQPQAKPLIQAS
jgi:hypothetical protein